MQISVYSMHKNLTVCKIIEAMHTAYAIKHDSVSRRPKQNMTQAIAEHMQVYVQKESSHYRLQRTFYFAESEWCFWNASFTSLFLFGTQFQIFSCPLAYGVCFSSRASVTAAANGQSEYTQVLWEGISMHRLQTTFYFTELNCGKCALIWRASFISQFLLVATHFWIFQHKFRVHLGTMYAPPQELVWLLSCNSFLFL